MHNQTRERGHYELAAGRDVTPFIQAMEQFAGASRLLPEQVWDEEDLPEAHMYLGQPTGSAMPLMWAHAKYLKLLCSAKENRVYDLVDIVADRYLKDRDSAQSLEVWKFNRQIQQVEPGQLLRIQALAPLSPALVNR